MQLVIRRLLILMAFTVTPFVFSQPLDSNPDYSTLASSREWLSLLHVPRSDTKSFVVDPQFFLAESGRHNPEAELRASVQAFRVDSQLICKFPARYQFLRQYELIASQPIEHCSEYLQWRKKLDVQGVVLVLASSYLNSPSSMYGHSFLRFDPGGERAQSPYLSYAMNFGAQIPAAENGMLYAYRGVFGGYPGYFSLQPYYEKIQEYTRLENRDMWEYQLALSADEIERLLSHSWELNGIQFGYYFFDENCAYRLLELLEVARPSLDLTTGFEWAAMPVDTIRRVVNDGLVESVAYRASRHSELESLSQGLSRSERYLVVNLAEGHIASDDKRFSEFSPAQKQRFLLAAYRLLRYRDNREQRDPIQAQRALALLKAANTLGRFEPPKPERPLRPDKGHPTSLFALDIGAQSERTFVDMEWRISYHDAVDWAPGYPEGATLEMGQLRLRWQERAGLDLQQFVPVHIRSLSQRDVYAKPISWQVQGIAERLPGGETPLVAAIHGGAGASWSVLGGTSYLLPSVRLEHNPEFEGNWQLGIGAAFGQLWQRGTLTAELSAVYQDFSNEEERWRYGAKINYRLSGRQAVRLRVEGTERRGEHDNEVGLSWRYYF